MPQEVILCALIKLFIKALDFLKEKKQMSNGRQFLLKPHSIVADKPESFNA